MLHFVGFRGDEYHSAVKTFGPPDFYHRCNDPRLEQMVHDGDVVIYANGHEHKFTQYTFDDSRVF